MNCAICGSIERNRMCRGCASQLLDILRTDPEWCFAKVWIAGPPDDTPDIALEETRVGRVFGAARIGGAAGLRLVARTEAHMIVAFATAGYVRSAVTSMVRHVLRSPEVIQEPTREAMEESFFEKCMSSTPEAVDACFSESRLRPNGLQNLRSRIGSGSRL